MAATEGAGINAAQSFIQLAKDSTIAVLDLDKDGFVGFSAGLVNGISKVGISFQEILGRLPKFKGKLFPTLQQFFFKALKLFLA